LEGERQALPILQHRMRKNAKTLETKQQTSEPGRADGIFHSMYRVNERNLSAIRYMPSHILSTLLIAASASLSETDDSTTRL
jgi:hypothetical protein